LPRRTGSRAHGRRLVTGAVSGTGGRWNACGARALLVVDLRLGEQTLLGRGTVMGLGSYRLIPME